MVVSNTFIEFASEGVKGFTRVPPDVNLLILSNLKSVDMKISKPRPTLPLCLLLFFFFHHTIQSAEKNSAWVKLFNGKDLSGWHNPYSHGEARVKNGIIELVADKKFFLAHDNPVSDFILTSEIKLPLGQANSGILFRSQKRENGTMFGYQAEVDGSDRKWSGGLYDEGRRGWIHPKKPIENPYNKENWTAERKNAFKREEWNKYKIKCLGDRIQIWVNGVKTSDLRDGTDTKGLIAIQHHGEKGQVYQFRNLRLKKL